MMRAATNQNLGMRTTLSICRYYTISIVMDNAPYHSMQTIKIPNMTSRKDVMQGWLTANDIP